jgi:uncharacterized protein YijF (DUF1287 family)
MKVLTTPKKSVASYACLVSIGVIIAGSVSCSSGDPQVRASSRPVPRSSAGLDTLNRRPVSNIPEISRVVDSALEQTQLTTEYDSSYEKISYPGGDVPIVRGVCADVIVRAFRNGGVDLQKEIHEDMNRHFGEYPMRWGARKPDSNIDHRRVPNLMTFFSRKGKSLRLTQVRADYLPGDVVAWELDNKLLHIGIVTDAVSQANGNYLVVHNIGAGAKLEDVLLEWKLIGHYRFWN